MSESSYCLFGSLTATRSLTKDMSKRPKYELVGGVSLLNQPFILEHGAASSDIIAWFRTISPSLSCASIQKK